MADIEIRQEGPLLFLELNRPEKSNALSEAAVEMGLAALSDAAEQGVQLAIFSGRGKNFCGGFDLLDLDETTDAQLLWRMVRLELFLQAVFHAPFVTLALAQGNAVGAGADLFCACTRRIAAPGTHFRMPGWRFGIALGTRRLAHRTGPDAARDLLLASTSFDAERALSIGLVQEIKPPAGWPDAQQHAERLAMTLARDSVDRLLRLSSPDTRDADLAALVSSACRPGLRDRMIAYRNSVKRS